MPDETREVGIILKISTAAAKGAIGGVRSTSKAAQSAIKKFGAGVSGAFGVAGRAIEVANQGFQLLKDSVTIAVETLRMFFEKAIEFRSQTDPMFERFKDINRETELLRARMGDSLIPIIVGLADAMEELSGGPLSEWIAKNQQLIGTRIVEFLSAAAETIINVLVPVLRVGLSVWKGWEIIITGLEAAIESYLSFVLGAYSKIIAGAQKVAKFLGADGIAGAMDGMIETTAKWSGLFEDAAGDAIVSIGETAQELISMDAKLSSFGKNSLAFVKTATEKTLAAVKNAGTGAKKTVDEVTALQEKAAEKQEARETRLAELTSRLAARRIAEIQAQMDLQEEQARAVDEKLSSVAEAAVSVADAMGDAMSQGFLSAIEGTKTWGEAVMGILGNVIQSTLQVAKASVIAWAAEAAAKAASASAFFGPIAAAVAASTMFGVVSAFTSKIQAPEGFARGGVVRGGIPGVDSVPALLQQDEIVLTSRQGRSFLGLMDALRGSKLASQASINTGPGFASGGIVGGGGGGSGVTVNLSMQSLGAPSRSEQLKIVAGIREGLEQAMQDGLVAVPG